MRTRAPRQPRPAQASTRQPPQTLLRRSGRVESSTDAGRDERTVERKVPGHRWGDFPVARTVRSESDEEAATRAGQRLPADLRARMEESFRADFSEVRVYQSPFAAALHARAFARRSELHFKPGEFDPHSRRGQQLIGHELAHVVQQRAGQAEPTAELGGLPLDDRPDLENQAERHGEIAARGETIPSAELASPAAVASSSPATPTAAPVQAQLELPENLPRDAPENLRELITTYNEGLEDRGGDPRHAHLSRLRTVRQAAYGWFGARDVEDLTEVEGFEQMQQLLNSVQSEHVGHIKQSLSRGEEHAPVAGYGDLGLEEQTRVDRIWNSLRNSEGNIKIEVPENDDEDFQPKVMSSFSRLLEGGFGRDLVESADRDKGHDRRIRISPASIKNQDFEASPIGEEEGVEKLDDAPEVTSGYISLNPNLGLQDKTQFLEERGRDRNPRESGFKIGGSYFKFGQGSGAEIPYPTDLQDVTELKDTRFLGTGGQEIIAPNYISLGHELGHAVRMNQGSAFRAFNTELTDSRTELGEYFGDNEELVNIRAVENRLRAEHQLPERKGHSNAVVKQKNTLQDLVARESGHLDKQSEKYKKYTAASDTAGGLDIKEARRLMEEARRMPDEPSTGSTGSTRPSERSGGSSSSSWINFGSWFSRSTSTSQTPTRSGGSSSWSWLNPRNWFGSRSRTGTPSPEAQTLLNENSSSESEPVISSTIKPTPSGTKPRSSSPSKRTSLLDDSLDQNEQALVVSSSEKKDTVLDIGDGPRESEDLLAYLPRTESEKPRDTIMDIGDESDSEDLISHLNRTVPERRQNNESHLEDSEDEPLLSSPTPSGSGSGGRNLWNLFGLLGSSSSSSQQSGQGSRKSRWWPFR